MNFLKNIDPEIFSIIQDEENRQETTLDLIASENYTSQAVMQATGSVLTNKYAEGYPGKRYYGGCEFVDNAESLAQERCKKLFGAEHVNVQPHAGSQANMAVFYTALELGDTIMGMSLAEGGHLTHGHKVSFSGKFYKSIQYTVDKQTEQLDYDEIERLAQEHKPKLIIAGASAYSRPINFKKFTQIAQSVGAYFMADIAHIAGLVATGLHESPVGLADFITSTTHKTLRGPRGGLIMCKNEFGPKVDKAIMPGLQGGPFMNIIAAKAVAFHEALQEPFTQYQKQVLVNAKTIAQALHTMGYRLVAGGTDNHMLIVDMRSKDLNGQIGEQALNAVGISISRSCVPFDTQPPWITSGIRIGTPAVTTRGMKEAQMEQIAQLIDDAIMHRDNQQKVAAIKKAVSDLCKAFTLCKK
ncbi:MAG: serine hydroxymethyltransferase [Candidatus Babeliales bacterium]